MAASLLAILALVIGLTKVVRRLQLRARAWLFEAALAWIAIAVMALFASGAACWVVADGAPGPTGIYAVGAIDVVGLAVLGTALAAARQAVVRARSRVGGDVFRAHPAPKATYEAVGRPRHRRRVIAVRPELAASGQRPNGRMRRSHRHHASTRRLFRATEVTRRRGRTRWNN